MVDTIAHYRTQERFALHAFVVMPDHLHLLITPAPDISLEKAIQFIRGGFSYRFGGKSEIWQRGHFDKRVPNGAAYRACIDYIHRNPIAARFVDDERKYSFSSAAYMGPLDPMPAWFRG